MWKPELPKDLNNNIQEFTRKKLPAFFKYAKDKNDSQIESRNQSFVNKLFDYIPDQRIDLRWLKDGTRQIDLFDYKMLLSNPKKTIRCPEDVKKKYTELSTQYAYKISQAMSGEDSSLSYLLKCVKDELSSLGYKDETLADYLVEYLYLDEKRNKGILWAAYGKYIINNLKNNLGTNIVPQKIIQCKSCGEYIEIARTNNRTCRCFMCQTAVDEQLNREYVSKFRACKVFETE